MIDTPHPIPDCDPAALFSRRDVLRSAAAGTMLPALLAAADADPAPPFLVTPYVQLGDHPRAAAHESLTLMWHAIPNRGAWQAEYRVAGDIDWLPIPHIDSTTIDVPGIPAHVVLDCRLQPIPPGNFVDYRVLLDGQQVFLGAAPVRAPASQAFRCVVMGDVGAGSPQQKQVAYQAYAARPEFVLVPGDFVYNNGRISEYRTAFYPAYTSAVADAERGASLLASCCFFGGRGQHDTEAALSMFPDGHAYFLYWSFPRNGPPLAADSRHVYPLSGDEARTAAFRQAAGERFPRMTSYSFDWGASHWVVLDTWNPHIDWTDPALRDWLRADLAAARDCPWKIVSSYLPPFSSSTAYPQGQKMRVIVDLLEEAGVDLVFSGYAHSYQRTCPLRFRPDAAPTGPVNDPGHLVPGQFTFDRQYDGQQHTRPDGIIYVVSGCGGNPQLHSPEQTDKPQTWQPYTVQYNASLHQFTQLDISATRLTARQISFDGHELDRFELTKPARSADSR